MERNNQFLDFILIKTVEDNVMKRIRKILYKSLPFILVLTLMTVMMVYNVWIEMYDTPPLDNSESRKDTCNGCFLHDFRYLINNDKICDVNNNTTIDIIILILTIHGNKKQRDTIRATWLTYAQNNTANVRYAFLLGYTNNTQLSIAVAKEAEIHGDILKENFKDSYMNLTRKTMMAFRWATTYCPNATFLMKTDDDMWVNIPSLLTSVKNNSKFLHKGVGGTCELTAGPIRLKKSKWFASYKSYPHKQYPGFCAGPGYVTSMTIAKKILNVSKHVPFFHLEDVYVALCVKALKLNLYKLPGYHNYRVKFDPCLYKSSEIVTSHSLPPEMLREVWNKKCHSYSRRWSTFLFGLP